MVKSRLRTFRIVSQVFFFLAFIISLFFLTNNTSAFNFQNEWFLWLNPLTGLMTQIASRSIILPVLLFGGAVAIATLFLGRFFCGGICPLGAMIDFSDRYLFRRIKFKNGGPPRWMQKLKYVLLIAVGTVAVFGATWFVFADPISLTTRFFSIIVHPLVRVVSSDAMEAAWPLVRALELQHSSAVVSAIPLFYGGAGVILVFSAAILGGLFDRRFWCQYVCPSGALFGVLSRTPLRLFNRRVNAETCNDCKKCAVKTCPTHAIDGNDVTITYTDECILCGNCAADPRGCTSFAFGRPETNRKKAATIERRHVLGGVLGGLAVVPLLRVDALGKHDRSGKFVRPPGAVPEESFLARCIRCGECMKACPTNALQPATASDGFSRYHTPRLTPRIGGCEEKCRLCGHVCPTGAIRALPYEQKRFVKIGTAVLNRRRCLAWEQNKECLVCDEVCPYNAITPMLVETTTGLFRVPVINEDLCLGCGMCEQHCPITDEAAITVSRFGEVRLEDGAYVTGAQKEDILKKRHRSDSHAMSNLTSDNPETGSSSESEKSQLPPGFTSEDESNALPPGFVTD